MRSWVWIGIGAAPWIWVSSAGAQELDELPFDATGPDAPPQELGAPITQWSSNPWARGELQVGVLGEGAAGLLQASREDSDVEDPLANAAAAAISAAWAPHERFGVGVTASVWGVPAGLVLGRTRIHAPLHLIHGERFDLVAHPWLALPASNGSAGVAARGLSGGGVLAGRIALADPLDLHLNLGGSGRGLVGFPANEGFTETQRIGGPSVDLGTAVELRPGKLSLFAEFRGAWTPAAGVTLDDPEFDGLHPEWFGEAGGSVQGPITPSVSWRAGGAAGVTGGIGAATARGYLGLTFRRAPERTIDIVQPDGPADGEGTLVVVSGGAPLLGAIVRNADGEVGRTGVDGRLNVASDLKGLTVEAAGYARVEAATPDSGGEVEVELVPFDVPVPMIVVDGEGNDLDATVRAVSGDRVKTLRPRAAELPPGQWELEVSAEGFGTQKRRIDIAAGVPAELVEVVLRAAEGNAVLTHTVRDANGDPVPGATVLLDGVPIGTTGADGTIELAGLAEGQHALTILHPRYTAVEQPLDLTEGEVNAVITPLARVPGTVKVVARTADGIPVTDAVVRFAGPRMLAPMPLGASGERTEVLGPGDWQLLVSSVQYGFQQRALSIPEASWALVEVDVVLQPDEGGQATLSVRVVDPDGRPVSGAAVALDGVEFGTTTTGGALELAGLNEGVRALTIASPHHRELDPIELALVNGLHEEVVTLPWKAGSVRVTARSPQGVIQDAAVRFAGPSMVPSTPLGGLGEGLFTLAPGQWTALVTSPTYGIQQRTFAIEKDDETLAELQVVLSAGEEGLANLSVAVMDPEGAGVDGAQVFLDSIPLGASAGGTVRAEQLAVGRRQLEVESPLFSPFETELRLTEGDTDEEVALDWAPGAVRVTVVDERGRPVTDGVLRLLGERAIPPSPVDDQGQRVFALSPGPWQALAVSPTLGMAQISLDVDEASDGIQEVRAEIESSANGLGSVVVRVVDERGRPVPDAEITLDGVVVGSGEAGGVRILRDVAPGPHDVSVTAPHHGPGSVSMEVVEGNQVRYVTVPALPGQLTVRVVGQDDKPVDAEVSLLGPEDWMPMRIGSDGEEVFLVAAGSWNVVARGEGLGAARAKVELSAEGEASVRLKLDDARVEVTPSEVVVRDVVLFDTGAATLKDEADALLDEVASTLLANPEIIRVEVKGHTDNRGNLAFNVKLSQDRAQSVVQALIDRGVAPEKLRARGFGATRPIADNATESGRAQNRRVEIGLRR